MMSVIRIYRQASFGRHCDAREYLLEEAGAEQDLMVLDEDVAKRRAIVNSHPTQSAKELCAIFDRHRIAVPKGWKDADIEWWTKAYCQSRFRGRVHDLISRDRTKVKE
jgi:hypothetical protein